MIPEELHVLLVDEANTCRFFLEQMLMRCQFKVTAVGEASEALVLLRDSTKDFDIVLAMVCTPGEDGFDLIKTISNEMDKPVIMLTGQDDKKLALKGTECGACDCILKPIKFEQLKNIWLHVTRKQMVVSKKFAPIMPQSSTNKRKESSVNLDHEESDLSESDEGTSKERTSLKWTGELHEKFLAAILELRLAGKKEHPEAILKCMDVPGLTRNNISSHLQKYRAERERKRQKVSKGAVGYLNIKMSEPNIPVPFPLQNTFANNYPSVFSGIPSDPPFSTAPSMWTNFLGSSSNTADSEMQFPSDTGPNILRASEAHGSLAINSFVTGNETPYYANLDEQNGGSPDHSVWSGPQITLPVLEEKLVLDRRSEGARDHVVWASPQITLPDEVLVLEAHEAPYNVNMGGQGGFAQDHSIWAASHVAVPEPNGEPDFDDWKSLLISDIEMGAELGQDNQQPAARH